MSTVCIPSQIRTGNYRFRLLGVAAEESLLALLCCFAILSWFIQTDQRFHHWFVFPVLICGALIGGDAIGFIRGRLDVMDPSSILGLLGLHFFFIAPLLHVLWETWIPFVVAPPDWREWLGWMAALNVLGLVLYRMVRLMAARPRTTPGRKKIWLLDAKRTTIVLPVFLVITAVLQLWVYVSFGGISGYIDAYLEGERHYGNKDAGLGFNGMGWIFMISESFPILALFAFSAYLQYKGKKLGWVHLSLILLVYFALVMFFGGLRGSRSNTIWALFWAVGVLHFRTKRISRSFLAVGMLFLITFMYLYGFFKSVGTEALDAFQGSDSRDALSQKTHRTFRGALLGDLGRSDIQALALYKITSPPVIYQYAWGQTYLGGISILIPRALWPDRPPDKVRWVTELEAGPGSYALGLLQSSHVYGLAGEAMLNFGPIAVPFMYLLLGLAVNGIRGWMMRLDPDDSRWLMVPLLVMLSFQFMINDSDVTVFFIFKYATIPLLAVILCSRRTRADRRLL